MHWTAGFRLVFISNFAGPPPVMCIVRLHTLCAFNTNFGAAFLGQGDLKLTWGGQAGGEVPT